MQNENLKSKISENSKISFLHKKNRLPKSVRKFIRKEKARIRREVLDLKEQEEKIKELYQKLEPKDKKPTQS